ncbi:phage GP46 family protein [Acetobacter oeni]|uniref:Bacteriophage protein n=1 Tax=Acetobacter oeni TaxID=304077 RepID=A0A511XNZ8_9PROT|nr:phage GP46 family protein [Acetobacter oeni]MBB3884497.1 phage gp46-like protein [Acetobacter oeni]NHO20429.1 hypothetical protein [Acetobacter oeni]GBR00557.1 Mu-like prophage protein gp46 [Acetobacter oeni LMG 21952]GEN64692.1 hypothetical protein AOE01nite_29160 [Acetobacter oeni]
MSSTIPVRGGDILIEWNVDTAEGDWSIENGSLATSQTGYDTLKNAVLLSLFTDRVAPSDWDGPDRRGWWADTYRDSPIGSLLWLLARRKISNRTTLLGQARRYCLDALQWMVTAGVAKTINVSTAWATSSIMAIMVSVVKPDGTTSNYNWLWRSS